MAGEPPTQSVDAIVRACAGAHPGYELVGYGEVGLPFFELRIDAEILDRKPIDPFAEFVLRAVSSGVDEVAGMERLLGLDSKVLETTLVSLVTSDHLRNAPDYDSVSITELGEEALETASQIQAKTRQLRVAFDPLLKSVIEPFGEFLQPAELADAGIKEVGVPVGLVPDLRHIDVADVERVVRQIGRGREQERDVLALRSMRRFRVFRPALAIAFRADETTDVVVDLAFVGRVSDRHSRALAELGLQEKLGAKSAGRDRIRDRRFGLRRAKEQPDDGAVKVIPPYELRDQLEAAIEQARELLIITSPGVQGTVLDEPMVAKLEACLKRGVSVHIGWGHSEGPRQASDPEAVKALDRLASASPNLNVRQLSRRIDNLLICDSRYSVASDFSWLSHLGDATSSLGDERGLMVSDSAYVDYLSDKMITSLTTRQR